MERERMKARPSLPVRLPGAPFNSRVRSAPPPTPAPAGEALPAPVERAFGFAILLAALRCTLQYVLLPFVLPWLGLVDGVPPWLTLALGALALLSLAFSVRRLWQLRHPRRWSYLALAGVVIAALLLFGALDLRTLLA